MADVLSVYHFGHQGGHIVSPSHLLHDPCKLLARDELVLEVRLADGGSYDSCDLKIGKITLTLKLVSLMAREIELQKSVQGGVADIDAGDERNFEIGLEWADDCTHLM